MVDQKKEPLLLTPGPLTTSNLVKEATLKDWGSRDQDFIELTARICRRIEDIAGVDPDRTHHVCVPVQGSGTFAVEAALDTVLSRSATVLVLINGAYGHRIARICGYIGRSFVTLETAEDQVPTIEQIEKKLSAEPAITHLATVHCETTSGILNPIEEIASLAHQKGIGLIIDAMSSLGALPLDVTELNCAALVASSNKCLQGLPGVGFAVMEKTVLAGSEGNATSLSLDLFDQWRNFEKTGQWRFTPPTHVLAALDQALVELDEEGGVAGRGTRYQDNCQTLVDGMRGLGFETYLPDDLQAPIIVTFHPPKDLKFGFEDFYNRLRDKGFAIYPGKLTQADSFRMGCIGDLSAKDIKNAVTAVGAVIGEMGIEV